MTAVFFCARRAGGVRGADVFVAADGSTLLAVSATGLAAEIEWPD